DRVEAGQALAQLDTTDLDKSIADVRKSIAEAEASDALSRTQTERKLQDAIDQYNIDETKHNKAVSGAESTLNAAKKEKSAAADERKAKKAVLDAAQAAVDGYAGDTGLPEYTDLVNALTAAQGDYDLADQAYQGKKTAADQAQSAYDSAVQLRDTTLRQDNISIENTRDSIDSLKLKDSASAYRSQLEGYLEDREKCVIEAPVSGTVTAMTAEVGQSAGGSAMGTAATAAALFTIEDTDRLEITASIPEYDAILVQVGMQVSITSDAIDGTGWTGTVKSISPKATDASGNFTVVVEVVSPVGELAIGMSAKINIITEAETGVFAVPYDAVTTNAQGESVVYLLDTQAAAPPAGGGEAPGPAGTPMVVETGMETDYYIEISAADLEEGLVILADPEGKNVSTDSGGSGMAGFRVGGGG
ncbi:efflux RND transporter periplasmic adaptor subunit, partial [Ruminococcaceae bacterium OttesenSCG-928-A11]|nr:efflux RND transporter periplasmic adaptor subunit [Ruminococcaceae bacterium OttesenSCG-928-A11]